MNNRSSVRFFRFGIYSYFNVFFNRSSGFICNFISNIVSTCFCCVYIIFNYIIIRKFYLAVFFVGSRSKIKRIKAVAYGQCNIFRCDSWRCIGDNFLFPKGIQCHNPCYRRCKVINFCKFFIQIPAFKNVTFFRRISRFGSSFSVSDKLVFYLTSTHRVKCYAINIRLCDICVKNPFQCFFAIHFVCF